MGVAGHLWTMYPRLRDALVRRGSPPSVPFRTTLRDEAVGDVTLTGELSRAGDGRALVVLVHGMGGSAESVYCRDFARRCSRRGLSSLRLNLRGADRSGDDFGHAGLAADIHGALADDVLAGFTDLYLIGFSLGGHVCLTAASEELDARVRRVAALCPPVDLGVCQRHLDEEAPAFYRRHLLRGLKAMYRSVSVKRPVPVSVEEVDRIEAVREWDERVVVPRFGFRDAEDYYRRTERRGRLGLLRRPSLLVHVRDDPIVPLRTRGELGRATPPLVETWLLERGGHVGFRPERRGLHGRRSVEERVLDWLVDAGVTDRARSPRASASAATPPPPAHAGS